MPGEKFEANNRSVKKDYLTREKQPGQSACQRPEAGHKGGKRQQSRRRKKLRRMRFNRKKLKWDKGLQKTSNGGTLIREA